MELDDEKLVWQCLDGDESAFGFLIDKYKGSVQALAYRKVRNFHDAEEITQEVFLKAYKKLHTLKKPWNFAGWLYVITANHCRSWLRKHKREKECRVSLDEVPKSEFACENPDYELKEEVRQAVQSLPDNYRTVITLHYFAGMSCAEIGKFLGTSRGAIKDRLYRARKFLKGEMEKMLEKSWSIFGLDYSFTTQLMKEVSRLGKPEPSYSPPRISKVNPISVATVVTVVMLIGISWFFGESTYQVEDVDWYHPKLSGIKVDYFSVRTTTSDSSADKSFKRTLPKTPERKGILYQFLVKDKRIRRDRTQSLSETLAEDREEKNLISGKVIKDNLPVPNTKIYLYKLNAYYGMDLREFKLVSETDSDGLFEFYTDEFNNRKSEEMVYLVANPSQKQYSIGWIELTEETNVENIVINLYDSESITGVVKDSKGNPIENAQVEILFIANTNISPPSYLYFTCKQSPFGTTTDESGNFVINSIPENSSLQLCAFAPDFARKKKVAKAAEQYIQFNLKPETRIEGRVVYGDTGKPAKNITIAVQGVRPTSGFAMTKTDENGYYAITNLPAGTYNVFLNEESIEWTAIAKEKVKVDEDETAKNMNLFIFPANREKS